MFDWICILERESRERGMLFRVILELVGCEDSLQCCLTLTVLLRSGPFG